MTPERWRQVSAVLAQALEREPPERAVFLEAACGSDAALRQEVESLLEVDQGDDRFLEPPSARPGVETELRARLVAGLSGRYSIQHELARGGMATVFLAHDLRHERTVALKVLHPELSDALGPERRFLREIRTLARLDHPHILPLLDSGDAQGQLWYTMPYVEGETLRDRLRREVQLPVEEAVRLTREIADALTYAHAHGVIHRDIKPENILVSGGHARVADFGIARALEAAGGETLTASGMLVGTPTYMSPEQAAGEPALDGRSDVYSLACVLYEMLAGEPPWTGPTSQAVISRRFTESPRPLGATREGLPDGLEQAVAKALALAPADRFHDAAEFGRALSGEEASAPIIAQVPRLTGSGPRRRERRAWTGAAVLALVLLLAVGALIARLHPRPGAGAGAPRRLAVLPFENLGGPENGYLVDGLTDEVRGKLAGLRTLRVIARVSSNQYRRTRKLPEQIAQELGVRYLVTGTVRYEPAAAGRPARIRVQPELVEVEDGRSPVTRWEQPFDAELADVFQLQADLAQRIAQGLHVEFGEAEEARLAERPTANLAAYDAYLHGEQVSNGLAEQSTPVLVEAIAQYRRSVALDSAFALGWARLAMAQAVLVFNAPVAATAAGAHAESRRAAERALALAPALPTARLAMGHYFLQVEKDPSRAAEQFSHGLQLAPDDVELLTGAAWAEQTLGRGEAAVAHLRRATELDPRSVNPVRWLGVVLLWLRRYPEARDALERALAVAPADLTTLEARSMVELAEGDLTRARAVLHRAPREVGPAALAALMAWAWDLGWVLDDRGQRLLLQLGPQAFAGDRLSWGLALAQVHALRGQASMARVYADSARLAGAAALRDAPMDPQLYALYGVALAYLGRREEALQAARHSVELAPVTRDAYSGAYFQHQLARVHILLGEPEAALDELEPLLRRPYYLSPGWLRVDPTFLPLRGNPRFDRLAGI